MGGLVLVDGKLVVLAESGNVAVAEASPEAYKELAKAKVIGAGSWNAPVLAGGRLYGRTQGGELTCVDVSGK